MSGECIQISCRGMNKSLTNLNHLTTVADIMNVLLNDQPDKQYLTINDCCLYIECRPYLFPLKNAEFIGDVLVRYPASNSQFKLAFKRNSSPSRFAQRKKLIRAPVESSIGLDPYEQLRRQELLIQRQQEIITQLIKTNGVSRPSRQDVNTETRRSLSRVRFRMSVITQKCDVVLPPISSPVEVKSILKKSPNKRISSVDRDIDRLISLKQQRSNSYSSDDENLSERSTPDSGLDSLSSEDSVIPHQLETLV